MGQNLEWSFIRDDIYQYTSSQLAKITLNQKKDSLLHLAACKQLTIRLI